MCVSELYNSRDVNCLHLVNPVTGTCTGYVEACFEMGALSPLWWCDKGDLGHSGGGHADVY